MYGLLFPFAGIVLGSLIGTLFRKWIGEQRAEVITGAIGLCVVLIGLSTAILTEDFVGILICMFLGTMFGEIIKLEARLEKLGDYLENKTVKNGGNGNFSKAFVTASFIFMVGPMPIMGPIEAAVGSGFKTLLIQTTLDGVSSIVFASALGIGVAFSALTILAYEGLVFILAGLIVPYLTEPVILEMSAVGGLIIIAAGLNMIFPKLNLRMGNMMPAMFFSIFYVLIRECIII